MEQKSVGILISQAAAGGALGNFLLTFGVILFTPNLYNFLLFGYFPIILALGAAVGIIAGIVIWFSQVMLKRSLGFLVRSTLAIISIIVVTTVWMLVQKSINPDEYLQRSSKNWCD